MAKPNQWYLDALEKKHRDARINRTTDVVCFAGALLGGAAIDTGWRLAGWVLLFVSVACLFQRIRQLGS